MSLERVAVMSNLSAVMAERVPAIHVCSNPSGARKTWMPATTGSRRVTRRGVSARA